MPNAGMQQFVGASCFINFKYLFTEIVNGSRDLS